MNGETNMMVGDKVELLKAEIFGDDNDNELLTAEGTIGTVTAVDQRTSVTIYEIYWDNGTMYFYTPGQDETVLLAKVAE